MNKLLSRSLCVAAVLLASGCGWLSDDKGVFQDRSRDYLETPVLDPITIPEGMGDSVLQQVYVIPQIEGDPTLSSDEVIPRPEKLSGARSMLQLLLIRKVCHHIHISIFDY